MRILAINSSPRGGGQTEAKPRNRSAMLPYMGLASEGAYEFNLCSCLTASDKINHP